jgi:hypothetical protein
MTNKPQTHAEVLARFNAIAKAATPAPWYVAEHSWAESSIYSKDNLIASLSIRDEATEETQDILEKEMDANAKLLAAPHEILALANHQAAVIEAMRKALDWAEPYVEQYALSGTKERVAKALTLADAPYGDGK